MEDSPSSAMISTGLTLADVGQQANSIATRFHFQERTERGAKRTRASWASDLHCFAKYLAVCHIQLAGDLASDPDAWQWMTWGIVDGFVKWQLQEGYAISTVNRRLATIHKYAGLAHQVGALPDAEFSRIQGIRGFSRKEGRNKDEQREVTRLGAKKPLPTVITDEQVELLKRQPDTLQGRRDTFIVCLLAELGFRVGEVAALTVENINLRSRLLTFYRPKVDIVQTHRLPPDTHYAAMAYLFGGGPKSGPLWYATNKDGTIRLTVNRKKGGDPVPCHMSARAIEDRIAVLGKRVGVEGLYPHDLRHYWALHVMEAGTDIKAMMDAGGWSSPAMPLRYAKSTEIANERVKYKKKEA